MKLAPRISNEQQATDSLNIRTSQNLSSVATAQFAGLSAILLRVNGKACSPLEAHLCCLAVKQYDSNLRREMTRTRCIQGETGSQHQQVSLGHGGAVYRSRTVFISFCLLRLPPFP